MSNMWVWFKLMNPELQAVFAYCSTRGNRMRHLYEHRANQLYGTSSYTSYYIRESFKEQCNQCLATTTQLYHIIDHVAMVIASAESTSYRCICRYCICCYCLIMHSYTFHKRFYILIKQSFELGRLCAPSLVITAATCLNQWPVQQSWQIGTWWTPLLRQLCI